MNFLQYLTPDFLFDSTYVVTSLYVAGTGLLFLYVLSNGNKTIPSPIDADRPRDPARLAEGLPTDITFTPEEIRADPEILNIFDGIDLNNNLDIILEGQEHFLDLQAQEVPLTFTQQILEAYFATQEIILATINVSLEIVVAIINAFPFL